MYRTKTWGRLARQAQMEGGRERARQILSHAAFLREYPWLAGWTTASLDPQEQEVLPAGPNRCHGWGLGDSAVAHAVGAVATGPARRPALRRRIYEDVCLVREGVRYCVFRRAEVLEGVNAMIVDRDVERALDAPDVCIETGAFLGADNLSANPAHFLCDTLSRAVVFRDLLGLSPGQLCIDTEGSAFAEFAADAVIPGMRRLQPGACHRFGRLHLLSSTTGQAGHPFWFMEPVLHRTVREGLLRALPPVPGPVGERVYLARFDSSRRRLLNEHALAARLQVEGFRIITMSALGPAEQLATVRDAALVVAPHGAALASLVVAGPHTRVIELFNPRRGLADFAALARGAGAGYAALFGTPEPEADGAVDAWRIDIEAVLRAVDAPRPLQSSARPV